MITWTKQGAAVVGELSLGGGDKARVVLVGPRSNPKGAVLVIAGKPGGEPQAAPLREALTALSPVQVVEITTMQERLFGDSELPAPRHLAAG